MSSYPPMKDELCQHRIFGVPLGHTFLKTLALHIHDLRQTCNIQNVTLYLPYRRCILALENMLWKTRRTSALMMPHILCWQDLYTIPPSTQHKRRHHMACLIQHYMRHHQWNAYNLWQWVDDALTLLDQADIEEISWHATALSLAEHHRKHHTFLTLLQEHWPRIVQENGWVEPYQVQRQCMHDIIQSWQDNSPEQWIIGAGSTGTMPATARLLKAITQLPQGHIILPTWDSVGVQTFQSSGLESWTHPYTVYDTLMKRLDITPTQVRPLPSLYTSSTTTVAHNFLASYTQTFDAFPDTLPVYALEAASLYEEVTALAFTIRWAIEQDPASSITVVTGDTVLARRLHMHLEKWHIHVDNSLGICLTETLEGQLWLSILRVIGNPTVSEGLSLMHHPHVGCPLWKSWMHQWTKDWGLHPHVKGLTLTTLTQDPKVSHMRLFKKMMNLFFQALAPLRSVYTQSLSLAQWYARHTECWNHMSTSLHNTSAPFKHWHTTFAPMDHGTLTFHEYQTFMENELSSHSFPVKKDVNHVAILGHIEARLLSHDTVFLAGMNEDIWPPKSQASLWMTPALQKKFPPKNRRVGLSALDFLSCLSSASRIFLSRSTQRLGKKTIPSRFFSRLKVQNLCQPFPLPLKDWMKAYHARQVTPCPLPCPVPQVRPTFLSVSDLALWRNNPYGFYVSKILKLKPLTWPLGQAPSFKEYGTWVHHVLHHLTLQKKEGTLSLEAALKFAKHTLHTWWPYTPVTHLWWEKFSSFLPWIWQQWSTRNIHTLRPEISLKHPISVGPDTVTLYARADAIYLLDGMWHILDYKTGGHATWKDIERGHAPQLPLEGWLLQKKYPQPVQTLSFWLCNEQKVLSYPRNVPTLIKTIHRETVQWIEQFYIHTMGYTVTDTALIPEHHHLARWHEHI